MTAEEYRKSIKRCRRCRYGSMRNQYLVFCMYWAIVGHRRPCEGGPACSAFAPKGEERRDGSGDG